MKNTNSSTTAPKVRLLTHLGIASLAAFTLFNLPTLAGPQNPTVVAGNANFIQFGTHYAIQASNGAIINFDSFNIASFESVQFLQPSAAARVLARIAGGPTTIDGALTANGIVYLVNPAGVVFGNNAVVNAAGFYAAAANISNQNFLDIVSGATTEHVFTAPTGSIINNAGLSGGALAGIHVKNQVHLLGKHVSNQGIITVSNTGGAITLSAADGTIRLGQVGGNYIVQLDMSGAAVPGVGVDNSGVIRAINSGSIKLGAGDLYSLAAIRLAGDGITGTATEFNGNVRLASDVTLTTQQAMFNGSVDANAGGAQRSLTVQGGGLYADASATFNGPVGAVAPLRNIQADGDLTFAGSARFRGDVTAGGEIAFNGPVALAGSNQTVQAGQSLAFNGTIAGGGADLHLIAPEVMLGGNAAGIGRLEVSGVTRLGANITTSRGAVFNDAIILTGDSRLKDTGTNGIHLMGTVDGPFGFTVASANGNAIFGGNIGQITPLARFETIVGGTIIFEGNLVRAAGDILLNDKVNTVFVPAVATIGAAGDIHFVSLNGAFVMGQNQKLSAMGDLSISAATSATLGDLSSLGDMTVNANAILILTRNPAAVEDALGLGTQDTGVDFVAGGRFFFSVVPVVLGNGPRPQFASPQVNADANGTLQSFTMRLNDGVSAGDLRRGDGRFLDLRASGVAVADLRTVFADSPNDEDRGDVNDEARLSANEVEALRRIAIQPRALTESELADYAAGRGIYIDSPSTRALEAMILMPEVAIERLASRRVQDALAAYDRVRYAETFAIDSGERTLVDQAANVRGMLGSAWDAYTASAEGEADPVRFRMYLESENHPARKAVAGFRELAIEMRALGLTDAEVNRSLRSVLEPFTPDSMTPEQLRRVIR